MNTSHQPESYQGFIIDKAALRVLSRFFIIFVLMFALVFQPALAFAHPGDENSDELHAEEDLADTPMSEIEAKTNTNKRVQQLSTGVEPGAARMQSLNAAPDTISGQALAPADPGVSGAWSPVINTPVVPIFQAVLPNGKVLMWDSVGDRAAEDYPTHNFTRVMVWNPATDTAKRVDLKGFNIFCAGFAHLPNGDIIIAGGNKNNSLAGIVQTHIFHFRTETWSRGKDMKAGRWYPSLSAMANGEVAIVGGGPAVAEVRQANGAIRQMSGFNSATYGKRIYPFMASRPDTLLQMFGPYNVMYSVMTAGTGIVTTSKARDGKDRSYGSFATYDVGKTLVVGGGNLTEGGVAKVPTRTAVVVNTNTSVAPTVANTGSMPEGRRQHNATVLADGTVLVTGGMKSNARSTLVDLNNATTSALRWNPANGAWTVLASANRIRQYHSTATLLPDGRVLTGGGGVCGTCMTQGYLEKNIEYFSPPYLYKKDGSGQTAVRPVISTAPASVGINTRFTVSSAQAASIRKVALVGLSDATHSVDQGQRYIPLRFTVSGTSLAVTSPATGGIAPPGYYMLFITDAAGVPSRAKIILLTKSPNPVMSRIRNTGAADCIDVPGSSLAIRKYIWIYGCNGSRAQAMTRFVNDGSIRALGNCLDVPGSNFASGQKIWMYRCNNSNAQKWQFRTDGTIRPVSRTSLCLTSASTAARAAVTISGCSNHPRQKWTW